MIVVADTSPVNYLVLIGHADVLGTLFTRVVIPQAVHDELSSIYAPSPVRLWVAEPTWWLEVRDLSRLPAEVDPNLDLGERQAIALALEINSAALVIDEIKGRREARTHGLQVVGTIGLLERAHDMGLLDLRSALADLQRTSFFIAPQLLADSLRKRY